MNTMKDILDKYKEYSDSLTGKTIISQLPSEIPATAIYDPSWISPTELPKIADTVNHPKHYVSQGVFIEPIDLCRHLPFDLGNACKYLIRAGHKNNEVEDVKKAIWYLEDYLKYFIEKIKHYSYDDDQSDLPEEERVAKFYFGSIDTPQLDKFFMGMIWYTSNNKYIGMLFYYDSNRYYWGLSLQSIKQTIEHIKNDYKLEY